MPYYIRPTTDTTDTTAIANTGPYASRAFAFALLTTPDLRASFAVEYESTETEYNEWTERERSRFADGTYRETPWASVDTCHLHFCHVSRESPGMIAYTPDSEAGYANRKVRVRPGRYLEQFYSTVDLATRQDWIRLASTEFEVLQIATTPDQIETVFRKGVPQSCMGPDTYRNAVKCRPHPTRVYGNSDLAVAYTGPIDNATARVVIWPDKKLHTTIYPHKAGCGNAGDKLQSILLQNGYHHGDFDGARIRAVASPHGGFSMPYIDGANGATYDGTWLVLDGGDISVSVTCGYSADPDSGDDQNDDRQCDHCSDWYDESDMTGDLCDGCHAMRHRCDHCNDVYFADDDSDTGYCESCDNDRSFCESCDSDYFNGGEFAVSLDQHVCDDCARTHDQSRFDCQYCETTVHEFELSRESQTARIANGTACRFCEDCAEILTTCHACEFVYETANSPHGCESCHVAPRCPATLDLFSDTLIETTMITEAGAVSIDRVYVSVSELIDSVAVSVAVAVSVDQSVSVSV